jgi:copper chaperone CopZ
VGHWKSFNMFNLIKPKPKGTILSLKLSGLHCVSCSLNITGELEELEGVISVKTSYAKQETVITYDPGLIAPSMFTKVIEDLGYKVVSTSMLK